MRKIAGLAAGMGAVLLGALAYYYASSGSAVYFVGILCLLGIATCFVFGSPFESPEGAPDTEPPYRGRSDNAQPTRPWGKVVIFCLGALLILASLPLFSKSPNGSGLGWILWLAGVSVITGLALFLAWDRRGTVPFERHELVLFAVVFAIGAAFRCTKLSSYPFGAWFDEAQNLLVARQIFTNSHYRPVFIPDFTQLPALAFYIYGATYALVGQLWHPVFSARLITTIAGMLSLVTVWLLGRELLGRRVGLLAAAILAITRWHVTFSRFGVNQIFSTVVVPLALFFFFRAMRRRNYGDALLAGISVGIGLQFYYALVYLPVLMVGTFAYRLLWRGTRSPHHAGLIAVTLLTAVVIYSPVMQYARQNAHEFNRRMSTVSIIKTSSLPDLVRLFSEPSPQRTELLATLETSVKKHLSMFHLIGDPNGRHNLPGAPMLDPITGILFGIGVLCCLLRFWDYRSVLMLLWLAAGMSAGILTLAFEAPQGARTITITPVVALIAALPLAAFLRFSERTGMRPIVAPAVAILLAVAGWFNWNLFFKKQQYDPAAWASWSTPETKIGYLLRDFGDTHYIYAPSTLINGPTVQLISGQPAGVRSFERARDLPLSATDKGAIVLFDPNVSSTAPEIERLYPGVEISYLAAPGVPDPKSAAILGIATISKDEIETLNHWTARVTRKGTLTDSRAFEPGLTDTQGVTEVVFEGVLVTPMLGTYDFKMIGADRFSLTIDREELSASVTEGVGATLASGQHTIQLRAVPNGTGQRMALLWKPPTFAEAQEIPRQQMFASAAYQGGLLAEYYDGTYSPNTVRILQIDSQVNFYFHILPLTRPFGIRWRGELFAETAGQYQLGTSSIDGSTVILNGEQLVVNRGGAGSVFGSVTLEPGWHPIEVRYEALTNYNQMYLYWSTPTSGGNEIVPSRNLRPLGPVSYTKEQLSQHTEAKNDTGAKNAGGHE